MSNIGAIATGLSPGGISIIRVSGETAIEQVNQIIRGCDLTQVGANTINYCKIVNDNQIIDEVLVSVFKAPKSFTGEDTVEINCHGGILLSNRILNLLLQLDIELATPGEFSKRAFLNGKKTLEEVTVAMDLINAKNENALNLAINTLNESTNLLIEKLRLQLMDIISTIEVSIDYPEYDDIEVVTNQKLLPKIIEFKSDLNEIIIDSKRGELFKTGIDVAIIGSPNVGKSSLLNYLSNNNKAIVTNIPGTTRDIVTSEVNLRGLTLNLLDTAGIRVTDDEVEQIGIDRSMEQIKQAQLILYVVDGSRELTMEEIQLYNLVKSTNHIVIVNKDDQTTKVNTSYFTQYVTISALNRSGLDQLENEIFRVFDLTNYDSLNAKYISQVNDLQKLIETRDLMDNVLSQIDLGLPIDTIEIDLKESMFKLGEILGIEVKNDLLNELFSRFCLGK